MKLRDLGEAPIGDFGTIGDFSQDDASIPNASDRRAVTAEPMVKRIRAAWERTPFNFNLFFANVPGVEQYVEQGYVSDMTVKREFPEMAERILAGKTDGVITVVFTNNSGTDRVSFTPWIIAHRISHALVQPWNKKDPRQGMQNQAFYDGSKRLFNYDDAVKSIMYNHHQALRLGEEFERLVYEHIGTMKSARDGRLGRPREFYHELFAQYLLSGDITFNPFDAAFEQKVSKLIGINSELTPEDLNTLNDELGKLKGDLLAAFQNGLEAAKGKVIFM